MSPFFRKLIWSTRRRDKEAELNQELQFHLEEETDERQANGLASEHARIAARRELGNLTLLQESTRNTWTWTFWEQLLQDLRYAARTMLNNKVFTALAALSLALGIGANTGIYSFMDALLLRSLPVSDPKSLVVLNWHSKMARMRGSVIHGGSGSMWNDPKTNTTAGIFPFPAFELFQANSNSVFSSVFAYYPARNVNLLVKGQAERASGEYVSGDYFRGLEVPPAAGRLIVSDDDRAGAPAVVVLSFAYCQMRFGDVASAIGQSIRINNAPFTVVGVTPPGFFGVDPAATPDFYVPIHTNVLLEPNSQRRDQIAKGFLDQNYYWIEIMGRLRPGVSLSQAQSELAPRFHQWVESTASNDAERKELPALLAKEGDAGLDNLRRRYSKPLYVLLTMVALILVIACANIANLLLARAAARRREMAVRLSMGAGRFRVIRQLLTESLFLASLGGAIGVVFAVWGVRFLTLLLANGEADFTLRADLNWHVLVAAVALSLLTGVVFGLAPALQSTRVDVMPALKEIRSSQARSRFRANLSHVLVVAQIAISLLLVVAAGLFVRTLSNLQSIQLGFNRENILLFKLNARQAGHQDPEIVSFYSDLQKRFSAIPGVRYASLSNSPLLGEGSWFTPVIPDGKDLSSPSGYVSGKGTDPVPNPSVTIHVLTTGSGFFTTMQIPLLEGRGIEERDRPGSPLVAVVNEAYAKAMFGDRNPLGQHVHFEPNEIIKQRDMEIVGLAKNARYGEALTDDFPAVVYVPFNQGTYYPAAEMTFALRTTGDPLSYANTIRAIVHQADSRVPVTNLKTQAAQIDQTMNQEIIFAKLCTAFAILALTIACVGLYGTMAYTVARRSGEIGIRMALGAQRGRVIWMVLRQVVVMALIGLAIGVPIAYASSRLIKSYLVGMKPNDPLTLTIAIMTLLVAALLAGYAPARRASRIDPMAALRHE